MALWLLPLAIWRVDFAHFIATSYATATWPGRRFTANRLMVEQFAAWLGWAAFVAGLLATVGLWSFRRWARHGCLRSNRHRRLGRQRTMAQSNGRIQRFSYDSYGGEVCFHAIGRRGQQGNGQSASIARVAGDEPVGEHASEADAPAKVGGARLFAEVRQHITRQQ